MPIPDNVMSNLHANAGVAHQTHTQVQRATVSHAAALGRYIVQRHLDELNESNAASIRKVLALPKFKAK